MRVDVRLVRNAVSPSRTEFAAAAVSRLLNAPVRRRKSKRPPDNGFRGQAGCAQDVVLCRLIAIAAGVGGSFV